MMAPGNKLLRLEMLRLYREQVDQTAAWEELAVQQEQLHH